MNDLIYFDNASTTQLSDRVKDFIINYMDVYSNPASLYYYGQSSKETMNISTQIISDYLNCSPEEIYYTSGASESNSQIIYSAYKYAKTNKKGNHIVSTIIEHHSIMNALDELHKSHGVDITYVGTDKYGIVRPEDIERAIRNDTFLVITMTANNETGAIQNVAEIGNIAHKYGALFFTDATQAFCKINLEFIMPNVDYLSASAHKFHGPKGIGILYAKESAPLYPIIHGTQQKAKRGGTENPLLIGAMTVAIKQAKQYMYEWNNYVFNLTSHLRKRILEEIPNTRENGHPAIRLCGILNISFDGIRGEELLILLDVYYICVSTGSACNSASNETSKVLLALGLTEDEANSSIRFSLSHYNTIEEVDFVVDRLKECVERLRK